MDCDALRGSLFRYLDREVDEAERSALEGHLAGCHGCRRLVTLEQAFHTTLVAPLRPDAAPPEVRERVTLLLGQLARPPRPPRQARRWLRHGAAAAAVLLLAAGMGLGMAVSSWRESDRRVTDLADAAVEQHQRLTRGLLPRDIHGVSPKGAEEWFRKRLPFNVSLPELPNPQLAFRGGRVSHLAGVEVAALEYQVDGADVSLFVMPAEAYRRLAIEGEPRFKLLTHRGYDVIIWQSAAQGVGYTLVSEIGGRSCLVCHAAEERRHLGEPGPHL